MGIGRDYMEAEARVRELEASLASAERNLETQAHRATRAESERDQWKGRHLALAEDRLRLESERDEAVELLRTLHDLDNGWPVSDDVEAFLARVGKK